MEDEKDNLFKMYFTIQELNGKFSGFVQIGGFETEEEANQWAKKRSDDYKPNTKERRKLYEKDPKEWLQLYGDWTK